MLGRITLLSKQQSGFLMFVQRIAIFYIILNNVLFGCVEWKYLYEKYGEYHLNCDRGVF